MNPQGSTGPGLASAFVSLRDLQYGRLALLVLAAWVLIILVHRLLPWLADRLPSRLRFYILPVGPVLRLIILFVAFLEIAPLVVNPTPQNLLAIAGAAGLVVGFAFKDYISSLAAGVVAIYEKPYRPGDWVQIDGTYGEVKSLGLRAVKMVTPDDTVVAIPHIKIWTSNIANANDGKREHLCVADFYLHPAHDAERVRQKLWDVATASPYLQADRPIAVIVAEQPWGTHYRVKAYPIDGRDQFHFTSDLTVRGKAALTDMGVAPALAPAVPPPA